MLTGWRQRQQQQVITYVQEKIMRAKPRSAADVCLTDTECQRLTGTRSSARAHAPEEVATIATKEKNRALGSQTQVVEPNFSMP
jgi:hypothetical protein